MGRAFIFIIALSVGFFLVMAQNKRYRERQDQQKHEYEERFSPRPSSLASFAPSPDSGKSPEAKSALQTLDPAKHSLLLRDLQKEFGEGLMLETDPSGWLERLKGDSQKGLIPLDRFSSRDAAQVTARASDVFQNVQPLLWSNTQTAYEPGAPTLGLVSAQITYKMKWEGLRVEPQGNVSVDLGPNGELLSATSDVPSNLSVHRPAQDVGLENARRLALAQVSGAKRAQGGSKIVWVTRLGERPEGRVGYDFLLVSTRVIIDAENGSVLLKRDQKMN